MSDIVCCSCGKEGIDPDKHRCIPELNAALGEKEKELAEAQAWINDLQSGMYINCVYCGHRYGPNQSTPVSMADCLKAHIEKCPKHPMSALKAENAALWGKVERAIKYLDDEFCDLYPRERMGLEKILKAE